MLTPIKTIHKYKFEHFDTDEVRAIIKNRMMVVTLDHGDIDLKIPLDKLAGRVLSFQEKDGEFFCEWEPYPTDNGRLGKKIAKKGTIRPIGVGSISEDGTVENYRLLHVVIQKE